VKGFFLSSLPYFLCYVGIHCGCRCFTYHRETGACLKRIAAFFGFLYIFAIISGSGGSMIRIVRTFFGVSLFLVFWVGFVQAAEEAKKEQVAVPIIVVEESTYDFGQISEGEVVTHDFRVLNQGAAPLEIKNVKPG